MSPTIRVDDEVMDFLKANAEPFVDSPNSVLRRMLGLDQRTEKVSNGRPTDQRGRGKRHPANATPQAAFELPLLLALEESGGRARSDEAVAAVGRLLREQLTDADYEVLSSGPVRWENNVHWARQHLVDRGLLSKSSPRGLWEISDAGRDYIRQQD